MPTMWCGGMTTIERDTVASTAIRTVFGSSALMTDAVRPLRTALAGIILIAILLFLGSAWLEYHDLYAEADADARSLLKIVREQTVEGLESTDQLIREIDRRIVGMTWPDIRANQDALAADLRSLIWHHQPVSAIGLADGSGREWLILVTRDVTVSSPAAERDVTQQTFWTSQRDVDRGTFISRTDVDDDSKGATLAVSRRRTSPETGFDGTIQIFVPITYFTRFWDTALPAQARITVSLQRNDGTVLARSPDQPANRRQEAQAVTERASAIQLSSKIPIYDLVISLVSPIAPVGDRWVRRLIFPGSMGLLAITTLAATVSLAMRQARSLAEQQSRRIAAEEAALEVQRLEILGQLAAGVAHDFANVMQAVAAGAEVITGSTQDERVLQTAARIREAAVHGRLLTRRMLDFARDTATFQPAGIDPVVRPMETLAETSALLADTLGAGFRVRYDVDPTDVPELVRGERSGLAGALMNLAVNARDAMSGGGEIVIRLEAERIAVPVDHKGADRAAQRPCLSAGLYARISVADSGSGMAPAILARASEPFFTTKPRGQGTGLGLAGVRGFALAAGGGFHIESAENVGTTVTIWLPAVTMPQPEGGIESPST